MSLQPAFHESLPYIDPEPTPSELAAAQALIASELETTSTSAEAISKLPPPLRDPSFSPAIQTELSRIASSTPLASLNMDRYLAPDQPSAPADLPRVLSAAAVSNSHLLVRLSNLALLDRHGRNAWLLGNNALEAELASIERDLAAVKRDVDLVNIERKRRQDEVGGEMTLLEENWKKGVGRVLETEVAVEELKKQIRDEMRRRAEQDAP